VFKAIKQFFPKTFLGRSLTILFVPIVLLQSVMTYVFVDRHLSKVSELLAGNIASQVAIVIQMWDALPPALLKDHFDVSVEVASAQSPATMQEQGWIGGYLERALKKQISAPFVFYLGEDVSTIQVYLPDKTLNFSFGTKQLFLKTTHILLWWAILMPFFLLLVATLFMRNQVRPLRHLAKAVEDFGKGRDPGAFIPKGAQEVRRVARAFFAMRERVTRQREQRTQMLAGVSHDLRTPLTRMALQLAIMEETPDVQALKTDLQEMGATLESYLSFARGEGLEAVQDIDGPEFIQTLIKTLEVGRLKVTLPKRSWHFMGRPHALHRCATNLVGNALRYAPHVWMRVKIKELGVHIVVDDDGPGIAPQDREEVFKPFVRLEESRNPETGGMGLGLAIARDIARSHGGDITLDASPRGGLRARLFLPF
jgi:two-component system, OmpR family, osmolarity sensor histidine kinase EnvZ